MDNQDCLDLIEGRLGVLDLLDEQCRFAQVGRARRCRGGGGRRLVGLADGRRAADGAGCGAGCWQLALLGAGVAAPGQPAACPPPRTPATAHTPPPHTTAQATPKDLAAKLYGSASVTSSSRFSRPAKSSGTAFSIDHYAGPVTYAVDNFLDKNKDFVIAEHALLMQASRGGGRAGAARQQGAGLHAARLQPAADAGAAGEAAGADRPACTRAHAHAHAHTPTRTPSPTRPHPPQGAAVELVAELFGDKAAANGGGPPARSSLKGFQFNSVSTQFKKQLGELMAKLNAMSPHYVRCIKPNAGNAPLDFDDAYSLNQLKCGGVMEAVRISSAGAPPPPPPRLWPAGRVAAAAGLHRSACRRSPLPPPLTPSPPPPPPLCPAGYQYRRQYAAFLDNFWQLLPSVRNGAAPGDQRAAALLQRAGITDFKLGTTKVFLRWGPRLLLGPALLLLLLGRWAARPGSAGPAALRSQQRQACCRRWVERSRSAPGRRPPPAPTAALPAAPSPAGLPTTRCCSSCARRRWWRRR